jgi:hypothetical protein
MEELNLAEMSYDELLIEDYKRDGEVAEALNAQGLCYKTVCPECHVDDFTHVEGCSKQEILDNLLPLSYDDLYMANHRSNGKLMEALDQEAAGHWTICPECHLHGFQHIEGCDKLELLEDI